MPSSIFFDANFNGTMQIFSLCAGEEPASAAIPREGALSVAKKINRAIWDVLPKCLSPFECLKGSRRGPDAERYAIADDHNPPHVHIVGTDFQTLVRISDLSVIAGEAKAALLAEALEWARAHRDALALKWVELTSEDDHAKKGFASDQIG